MSGIREYTFRHLRYAFPADSLADPETACRSVSGGGGSRKCIDPGIEGLTDPEWRALFEMLRSLSSDGEPPPAA